MSVSTRGLSRAAANLRLGADWNPELASPAPASDAQLESLGVEGGPLVPEFSPVVGRHLLPFLNLQLQHRLYSKESK